MAVAERAGLKFPAKAGNSFDVVEHVPGNTTTDFGAPGAFPEADAAPVSAEEAQQAVALIKASWQIFDETAASAPVELRKGPRGGRDRDKIVAHLVESAAAYARKIGVKHRLPAPDDDVAIAALRDDIVAAFAAPSDGGPLVPKGWPARYAARRIAWHALDHAWEIEDRREPDQPGGWHPRSLRGSSRRSWPAPRPTDPRSSRLPTRLRLRS